MYTIQTGDTLLVAGREAMLPDTASFVKQCFIRTPHLFKERPVVVVTVYTQTGTDAFPLIGVEEDKATGETIFKITATNSEIGKETDAEYACDFFMMGQVV